MDDEVIRPESGRCVNMLSPEQEQQFLARVQAEYEERRQRLEREQVESDAAGLPALERLLKLAFGGSGQCRAVRRFLLCLYNSYRWHCELNGFRNLDLNLKADVLAVLRMDMNAARAIEDRLPSGDDLFRQLWTMEQLEEEADEEWRSRSFSQ